MSTAPATTTTPAWVIALACAGGLLVIVVGTLVYNAFRGSNSSARPSLAPALRQLRADGDASAFSITGLRWDGDTVVVDTALAPKAENDGPITGACTVVLSLVPKDAGSVMVYGQGVLGEEWFRGDAACHTVGPFG